LQVADLQAKDGLGLINGTAFITGVGSIALEASINIIKSIQPISALSLLALLGKP
jgi:histidine ammonia-lyase